MRSWKLATALSVGLGAWALFAAGDRHVDAQEGPNWLGDYNAARVAAMKARQPLLVAFR